MVPGNLSQGVIFFRAIVRTTGGSVRGSKTIAVAVMSLICPLFIAAAPQLSALAPANLNKPRPAAPFNLTGMWLHDNSSGANSWRFVPPTFKLTPDAQEHYDASQRAAKEGKVYRDDIGQCWPAGMPLIMTRVWPIAMV